MEEMSNKTSMLVEKMLDFEESVKLCKRELNAAECNLKNAVTELGKHLVPSDAKRDESFSMWVRVKIHGQEVEKLLTIRLDVYGDYHISWRT